MSRCLFLSFEFDYGSLRISTDMNISGCSIFLSILFQFKIYKHVECGPQQTDVMTATLK